MAQEAAAIGVAAERLSERDPEDNKVLLTVPRFVNILDHKRNLATVPAADAEELDEEEDEEEVADVGFDGGGEGGPGSASYEPGAAAASHTAMYRCDPIGRRMRGSKLRHAWTLHLTGETQETTIELMHSRGTGKKEVRVDGKVMFSTKERCLDWYWVHSASQARISLHSDNGNHQLLCDDPQREPAPTSSSSSRALTPQPRPRTPRTDSALAQGIPTASHARTPLRDSSLTLERSTLLGTPSKESTLPVRILPPLPPPGRFTPLAESTSCLGPPSEAVIAPALFGVVGNSGAVSHQGSALASWWRERGTQGPQRHLRSPRHDRSDRSLSRGISHSPGPSRSGTRGASGGPHVCASGCHDSHSSGRPQERSKGDWGNAGFERCNPQEPGPPGESGLEAEKAGGAIGNDAQNLIDLGSPCLRGTRSCSPSPAGMALPTGAIPRSKALSPALGASREIADLGSPRLASSSSTHALSDPMSPTGTPNLSTPPIMAGTPTILGDSGQKDSFAARDEENRRLQTMLEFRDAQIAELQGQLKRCDPGAEPGHSRENVSFSIAKEHLVAALPRSPSSGARREDCCGGAMATGTSTSSLAVPGSPTLLIPGLVNAPVTAIGVLADACTSGGSCVAGAGVGSFVPHLEDGCGGPDDISVPYGRSPIDHDELDVTRRRGLVAFVAPPVCTAASKAVQPLTAPLPRVSSTTPGRRDLVEVKVETVATEVKVETVAAEARATTGRVESPLAATYANTTPRPERMFSLPQRTQISSSQQRASTPLQRRASAVTPLRTPPTPLGQHRALTPGPPQVGHVTAGSYPRKPSPMWSALQTPPPPPPPQYWPAAGGHTPHGGHILGAVPGATPLPQHGGHGFASPPWPAGPNSTSPAVAGVMWPGPALCVSSAPQGPPGCLVVQPTSLPTSSLGSAMAGPPPTSGISTCNTVCTMASLAGPAIPTVAPPPSGGHVLTTGCGMPWI